MLSHDIRVDSGNRRNLKLSVMTIFTCTQINALKMKRVSLDLSFSVTPLAANLPFQGHKIDVMPH